MTNHITHLGDTQVLRRARLGFADVSRPVGIYMAVAGVVSVAVAAGLAVAGVTIGPVAAVVPLAIVAAVSEWRGRIDLRRHRTDLTVSISLFPSVFAAVLFGPLAGMAVFGASAIGCRIPLAGKVTYLFNRALVGAAAGAAARYRLAVAIRAWRGPCRSHYRCDGSGGFGYGSHSDCVSPPRVRSVVRSCA